MDERSGNKESQNLTWSKGRYAGLAVLFIGVVVLSLILLKGRYVGTLVLILIPLLGLGYNMVRKPVCSIESLIHDIYRWGVYLLALGLMFEPYQGGIKKDPATLSYYFVPGGLAIFTLLFFTIIIEIFKKKRILQLLIDNGQNPMIAYTAGGNLVGTTLAFIGISELVKKNVTSPWPYFCYSVAFTLLVALAVSFCTRKKIFWRT